MLRVFHTYLQWDAGVGSKRTPDRSSVVRRQGSGPELILPRLAAHFSNLRDFCESPFCHLPEGCEDTYWIILEGCGLEGRDGTRPLGERGKPLTWKALSFRMGQPRSAEAQAQGDALSPHSLGSLAAPAPPPSQAPVRLREEAVLRVCALPFKKRLIFPTLRGHSMSSGNYSLLHQIMGSWFLFSEV